MIEPYLNTGRIKDLKRIRECPGILVDIWMKPKIEIDLLVIWMSIDLLVREARGLIASTLTFCWNTNLFTLIRSYSCLYLIHLNILPVQRLHPIPFNNYCKERSKFLVLVG